MNRLVLICSVWKVGGTETLFFRIAQKAKELGYECTVYGFSKDPVVPEMEALFGRNQIKINNFRSQLDPKLLSLQNGDVCFTDITTIFMKIQGYVQTHKIDCRAFYYSIHPFTFIQKDTDGREIKHAWLRKLFFKHEYGKYIKSGNIFFMDETCRDAAMDYYGYKFGKDKCRIIRLPLDIQNIDDPDIYRKRKNSISILTVARSQFPFKGYMKGLIETFSDVCSDDKKNMDLTIISYGQDIEMLRSWIEASEVKDRIHLLVSVDYQKLFKEYYNAASLYVGMGTTVLEAASVGVPAVPIESYTYDCRGSGFLYEHPECVSAFKGGERHDIAFYIRNIIDMDIDEYISISLKCQKVIAEQYSYERLFDYLFDVQPKCPTLSVITRAAYFVRDRLSKFD